MKLVTYEQDGCRKFGVLQAETIVDLTSTFPDAIAFLEGGDEARASARSAADRASDAVSLDKVKLCTPVPNARKLVCAASNYSEHIREGGGEFPGKERMTPWIFLKPPSTTLVGPGDPIVLQPGANQVDWECELAAVIGRPARRVSVEAALDYVAGYTIVNDISERSLRVDIDRDDREWDSFFDWLQGKWFDTFAPAGPCLVLKDEIPDPQDVRITLSVNGETKQDGSSAQMIHTVAELVAWSSRMMTLEPGDIVATGTPSGVGSASGQFLQPGDQVVCEIEGIGALRNPVVKG